MATRNGEDPDAGRPSTPRDAQSATQSRLARLDAMLDLPMALLGLVWLAAIVAELVTTPPGWVRNLGLVIWGVFLVEFALRFFVSSDRSAFLRANWLSLVALALPALNGLRALRALRALQSLRVARVVAAFGRFKSELASLMRQHGLGYVLILTVIVTFAGAAAMYGAERDTHDAGFRSYADALWWTAMLITTIGSQHWPETGEGRVLALLLAGYSLGVLGYITAALSAFLIGRDGAKTSAEASRMRSLDMLHDEVAQLARQLDRLARPPEARPPGASEREPREPGERRV
jgi:voltage-gated potassium channel